jgi:hypothetical protein
MKCALEVEDVRAYWSHADGSPVTAKRAFDEYWFGARSMERVEVLIANMKARFDVIPSALRVLHAWPHMTPDTRRVIAHWHLQFADPLYRSFTGGFLAERRAAGRTDITRDAVVTWVGTHGAERWTLASRIQFASKLLSAAYAAGVVATNRDPRVLAIPRVSDEALAYLMYLLREVRFEGSLLANPYLASVGLEFGLIEDRLRALPSLAFRRQADLVDFGWRYESLATWAEATLHPAPVLLAGGDR